MFFFLSKLLHLFIEPFTWIMLCFGWAMLIKRKRRKWLKITLILFLFFTNRMVISIPENAYEPTLQEVQSSDTFNYGIVLGGYASFDERSQMVNYHESIDRLIYGLKLQDWSNVKTLILSGGAGSLGRQQYKEAEFVQKDWDELWQDRRYILEKESRNTYESALKCRHVLDSLGSLNETVLLVTSASHMPRARACFEKQGLKVRIYPVDPINSGPDKWYDYFLPDVNTLISWNRLSHEWFGFLMYRVRGYV